MPMTFMRMPIAIAALGMRKLVTTAAAAQTAAASRAWQPRRTPDGQPDIQGYWTEEAGIERQ